jgi:SAM-dependent methyltransferase
MQFENAQQYVLPFIENVFPLQKGMHVLEIGCAEGGVLKAFLKRHCKCYGVELNPSRVEHAKEFLKDFINRGDAHIIQKDIYDASLLSEFANTFDVIVLKDVIEHIHDQKKLITRLKDFIKPDGVIFFGFPPWQMPFGGHQQVCKKTLGKAPFIHLLPTGIYKNVLKLSGENDQTITDLLEVKQTGLTIERFEKIINDTGLKFAAKTFYFINPIYKYKFGLQGRKQNTVLSKIPVLRNFITTAVYYLITK